jgi:hypothetical protein
VAVFIFAKPLKVFNCKVREEMAQRSQRKPKCILIGSLRPLRVLGVPCG